MIAANTLTMCYAMFGVGHFLMANAAHYADKCISFGIIRTGLVISGMVIWLLTGKNTKSQYSFIGLWLYQVVSMHVLFSAAAEGHLVPLVLVTLGFIFSTRYDVCDAAVVGIIGSLTGLVAFITTTASPLEHQLRDHSCNTTVATFALIVSGILHIYPATVIYEIQLKKMEQRDEIHSAFVLACVVHLIPVISVWHKGNWVLVLLEEAYFDMLVDGVSTAEILVLATQCSILMACTVGTSWAAFRTLQQTQQIEEVFHIESRYMEIIVAAAVACLLLNLQFAVVVWIYVGVACLLITMEVVTALT